MQRRPASSAYFRSNKIAAGPGFDHRFFSRYFFDKMLAPAGVDPRPQNLRSLRAASKIVQGGLSGLLIPSGCLYLPQIHRKFAMTSALHPFMQDGKHTHHDDAVLVHTLIERYLSDRPVLESLLNDLFSIEYSSAISRLAEGLASDKEHHGVKSHSRPSKLCSSKAGRSSGWLNHAQVPPSVLVQERAKPQPKEFSNIPTSSRFTISKRRQSHRKDRQPRDLEVSMTLVTSAVKETVFHLEHDLASALCGHTASRLVATRWFRLTFTATVCFGALLPEALQVVLADCEFGQLPWLYPVPFWLDLWRCLGYWAASPFYFPLFGAMQRELLLKSLSQMSSVWIIVVTCGYISALVSLFTVGLGRSIWLDLPRYAVLLVFFPFMALSDALPEVVRRDVIRYAGAAACVIMATIVTFLNLPWAADAPGIQMWAVMGVESVTNLNMSPKCASILTLLLLRGVVSAWVWPNRLAFIKGPLVAETVGGAGRVAWGATEGRKGARKACADLKGNASLL